jgi:hypothetical protein
VVPGRCGRGRVGGIGPIRQRSVHSRAHERLGQALQFFLRSRSDWRGVRAGGTHNYKSSWRTHGELHAEHGANVYSATARLETAYHAETRGPSCLNLGRRPCAKMGRPSPILRYPRVTRPDDRCSFLQERVFAIKLVRFRHHASWPVNECLYPQPSLRVRGLGRVLAEPRWGPKTGRRQWQACTFETTSAPCAESIGSSSLTSCLSRLTASSLAHRRSSPPAKTAMDLLPSVSGAQIGGDKDPPPGTQAAAIARHPPRCTTRPRTSAL